MAWRFPLMLPAAIIQIARNKNTSIDEAPYEAFNLMHILELPIDGHIKLDREFFCCQIYNLNI